MKPNKILPDDPRVTAYALGEMEPAELAEFTLLLENDPEARAQVEEIRSAAQALESALATEPLVAPAPRHAAAPHRARLLRFPQLYFVVSGLAAACFAVYFAIWEHGHPEKQATRYVEVDLAKSAPNPAQAVALPSSAPVASAVPPPAEQGGGETAAEADEKVAVAELKQSEPPAPAPSLDQTVVVPRPAKEIESPTVVAGEKAEPAPAAPTDSLAPASVNPPSTGSPSNPVASNESATGARLDENETVVRLAPFEVQASDERSFSANSTLAGTRARALTADRDYSNPAPLGLIAPPQDGAAESWSYRANAAPRHNAPLFPGHPSALAGDINTESYAHLEENRFETVRDQPLSTFSADVDTASYANVRRFLNEKQRPPHDAVRIEEMMNYFPYHYAAPAAGGAPFAASLEVASAPWAPSHRLVRVALKARNVPEAARPAANLVFLIDVSGSMDEPNKLPLVKESMEMLLRKLQPDDRVAIVTYAGESGVALPSTPAGRRDKITRAIERLHASGSTNGEAGIQLAYDIARRNFVKGGVNRVILATDGDFNVGTTNEGELTRLIAEKARSGVFLTVLGFGMGNYKDAMLVQLADRGNGNYAYIDTAAEAHKALVEQASATLMAVAKDVKIQVEFNPARVQSYRLIGYDKRRLAARDFNDDRVDAGDIGAGHAVTALYEVVPVGGESVADATVDPLKYQRHPEPVQYGEAQNGELLTVKVRYKDPAGDTSRRLEFPLTDSGHSFAKATADFKFSAAVAAFGMILQESPYRGDAGLRDVAGWARAGIEDDPGGYRSEFVDLVNSAAAIE